MISRSEISGVGRTCAAFTRIELIVIVATVLLFVCLFVPSMARARKDAQFNQCYQNLKEVGIAFRTWSLDSLDSFPMRLSTNGVGTAELVESGQAFVHFRELSNMLQSPKFLVCPADKPKKIAKDFGPRLSDANVSYFVGADAQDTYPETFLAGDRNLALAGKPLMSGLFSARTNGPPLTWTATIHDSRGNICYGDGHVVTTDSSQLTRAAQNQQIATNRLVIP